MLVWLDGRSNIRRQPQENFARELMELFTMGVGTFAETDVYAGARVFTGWNLARPGSGAAQHYAFIYNAGAARHHREGVHVPDLPGRQQDDSGARGGVGHAGRPRSDHRRRRAIRRPGRGWRASCTTSSSTRSTRRTRARSIRWRGAYYDSGFEIEAGDAGAAPLAAVPRSGELLQALLAGRSEFVVRALKEVGWAGFSVNDALDAADQHGAAAVRAAGRRRLGSRARTGSRPAAMLARMNFAAQLATNQKFNLRDLSRGHGEHAGGAARLHARSADAAATFDARRRTARCSTTRAPASRLDRHRDAQLATKAAGLVAPDRRIAATISSCRR